jgi:hypothetical protein
MKANHDYGTTDYGTFQKTEMLKASAYAKLRRGRESRNRATGTPDNGMFIALNPKRIMLA